jgi:ABC-type nickel/cobalt efflux system permease component RcnA
VRLGGWWGIGHAGTLLVIGLPLIALKSELPAWLESGAERDVGVVVVLPAVRVLFKWVRGDYRANAHRHREAPHRHLRNGETERHAHNRLRSLRQALAIGVVHGLAGTGAVVLLLIAALPSQVAAAAALAVFAPMSVVSMALCSGTLAWVLTRRAIEPVFRSF